MSKAYFKCVWFSKKKKKCVCVCVYIYIYMNCKLIVYLACLFLKKISDSALSRSQMIFF